jgi:hypothetical protein
MTGKDRGWREVEGVSDSAYLFGPSLDLGGR